MKLKGTMEGKNGGMVIFGKGLGPDGLSVTEKTGRNLRFRM
jgi:hypothetical protein